MRRRWLIYGVIGLCFGLIDWHFLDLLSLLSQNDGLNQSLDSASTAVWVLAIIVLMSANYGIWLQPVIPAAGYEMSRSGSLRRAALSGVIVWSMAMVSYYAYYALLLMFVGLPHWNSCCCQTASQLLTGPTGGPPFGALLSSSSWSGSGLRWQAGPLPGH
nr:hypothetical protein [Anaerolineae bacterium]